MAPSQNLKINLGLFKDAAGVQAPSSRRKHSYGQFHKTFFGVIYAAIGLRFDQGDQMIERKIAQFFEK